MKVKQVGALNTESAVIRVVLIDEKPLLREGLGGILANFDDLNIIGAAAGVREAVERVENQPDVVIVQVHTQADASVLVSGLRDAFPGCRVIVLGVEDCPEAVYSLVAAGIDGYLTNPTRHELYAAIQRSVTQGDHVLLSVRRQALMRPQVATIVPTMTELEREVLLLSAQALSNSQIARRLNLTEATVKRHFRNIFAKLNAVSRIDAVNKAVDANLISRPMRQ
jgi:DNA-binding NarL/FixJ family response regulator